MEKSDDVIYGWTLSTRALLPKDSFARAIKHQFIELLQLLDLDKQTFRKYHGPELLIVLIDDNRINHVQCGLSMIKKSNVKSTMYNLHNSSSQSYTTKKTSTALHRGVFCQFPFRRIYYCGSNKST